MKVLFLSWSLCFITYVSHAQLADPPYCIEIIPHYEEPYLEFIPGCGGLVEIDLSGFVTYRIYAVLQDPEDCVQAVFGSDPLGNDIDCEPDSLDLCVEASCAVFQHPIAGPFAYEINPLFEPTYPSMEWDSFMTIDILNSTNGSGFSYVEFLCDEQNIGLFEGEENCDFFDGGNLIIENNAIFNAAGFEAGEDMKVLIAQITTCGDICAKFGIQLLDNCVPGNPITYNSPEINLCQPNPCLAFPMTTSSSLPLLCEGQEGLTFFEGGMGYVDYQLYEAETNQWLAEYAQIQGDLVLDELNPGSYYLSMIDSVGCRDTSEVFTIFGLEDLPVPFQASSWVIGSLNCSGDSLADINLNFTGGTSPYVVSLDSLEYTFFEAQEDYVFESMACGEHLITISDSLGCMYSEQLEIICYEPIELDLIPHQPLCAGEEGSVDVVVANNFSSAFLSWSDAEQFGSGNYFDLTDTLSFESILAGEYSLYVLDSLGCPSWYTVELTDPFELICSISSSDETFGNDAWACVQSNGGTGAISYLWNTGSTSICIENLVAGEYNVIITDDNGCTCSTEVELFAEVEEASAAECSLLSSMVSDELVIRCSSDYQKFEIVDIKGSVILSGSINQQKTISTQSLSPGKYFIKLFSPSSVFQLEFVKI